MALVVVLFFTPFLMLLLALMIRAAVFAVLRFIAVVLNSIWSFLFLTFPEFMGFLAWLFTSPFGWFLRKLFDKVSDPILEFLSDIVDKIMKILDDAWEKLKGWKWPKWPKWPEKELKRLWVPPPDKKPWYDVESGSHLRGGKYHEPA